MACQQSPLRGSDTLAEMVTGTADGMWGMILDSGETSHEDTGWGETWPFSLAKETFQVQSHSMRFSSYPASCFGLFYSNFILLYLFKDFKHSLK